MSPQGNFQFMLYGYVGKLAMTALLAGRTEQQLLLGTVLPKTVLRQRLP